MRQLKKQAREKKHLKSVSVMVLQNSFNQIAGRILAEWSDNPAGSVVTADVIIYRPENHGLTQVGDCGVWTGQAGGYGYDKLSAAIGDALYRHTQEYSKNPSNDIAGRGMSAVRGYFEKLGLTLTELI